MSSAAAPNLSSFGLEPPISPSQAGGLKTVTTPAAAPQPVAAPPQPAPTVETHAAPAPAPVAVPCQVLVRLANGERIDLGTFSSHDAAKVKARQMTRELEESRVWPFLDGRFIRPDSIISIDLEPTAL